MKGNHFDRYAADYEDILKEHLSFFDQESDYFAAYKIDHVRTAARLDHRKILEYGCGIGRNLKHLKKWFPKAEIFGCDVSEKSLILAAKDNPQVSFFSPAVGRPTEKFDLIFVSCVFHHIPPEQRMDALHDIYHLLDEQGEVFIFEHNPYNPVTVRVVKKCALDSEAVLITPRNLKSLLKRSDFKVIRTSYTLFFPSFLKILRPVEKYLHPVPFGGQYVIHAIKNRHSIQ